MSQGTERNKKFMRRSCTLILRKRVVPMTKTIEQVKMQENVKARQSDLKKILADAFQSTIFVLKENVKEIFNVKKWRERGSNKVGYT
mmetsp:Transcript_9653/g.24041  ORF Transcript_9653/g.24041 Transcript_9653/m.24041 type:complete len:87 (-) Transcript_9653:101-361(-)